MASSNPKIQALMDEVNALSGDNLEDKLNEIARLVKAEQMKGQQTVSNALHDSLTDPADAFACEGCQ